MRSSLASLALSVALVAWASPARADDTLCEEDDEVSLVLPQLQQQLQEAPTPTALALFAEFACRDDLRDQGVDCWPDEPYGSPRPDAPAFRGARRWAHVVPIVIPDPPVVAWSVDDRTRTIVHPGYARGIERPPR